MLKTFGLVLTMVASMARAEVLVLSVGGPRLSSEHALLPRVVRAKTGDTISFLFQPDEFGVTGNHSIVQTSAEKPCTPLEGGFSSPIAHVPGTSFNIIITDDTQPIYFACGSTTDDHADDHCQQGEVGVINPLPEDLDTTDAFDAASLVAQAEASEHDGAMDSVRLGGSPLGSGVGARVLGTFFTQPITGDSFPTSSVAVPAVAPSATNSDSVASSSSSNLSTAAIVGIAIGAVAFLALIVGLVARSILVKKRKAKTETFAGKVDRTLKRESGMVETKKTPTLEV